MTPQQFCKRVQMQLLKVEKLQASTADEQAKLHKMLSDGVSRFGPGMGVDVQPFSGGTPKPSNS
jgi:hypothetical protein